MSFQRKVLTQRTRLPVPPLLLPPAQNYFETIFLIRVPKKVAEDIQEELKKRGLPTTGKAVGWGHFSPP